jgi:Ser-Thr-rich glycosyl-phosphatidyl-inositol-anchored membrane family
LRSLKEYLDQFRIARLFSFIFLLARSTVKDRPFISRFVIVIISELFLSNLYGQDLTIKNLSLEHSVLTIEYDLVDSIPGRFYTVRLYYSGDGFLNPMTKTSGDIGLEVVPGRGKMISWKFQEEFGDRPLPKSSFEVRAKTFVPFINTQSINAHTSFKRGRKFDLTWKGGSQQNILNFDLVRGQKRILTFSNVANVGHHVFEIPTTIKPGKGYRFRISDSKNSDEVVFTKEFKIKRKVPLTLKSGIVVGVSAILVFLLSESENGLPDPFTPPNR